MHADRVRTLNAGGLVYMLSRTVHYRLAKEQGVVDNEVAAGKRLYSANKAHLEQYRVPSVVKYVLYYVVCDVRYAVCAVAACGVCKVWCSFTRTRTVAWVQVPHRWRAQHRMHSDVKCVNTVTLFASNTRPCLPSASPWQRTCPNTAR